MAIRRQGADIMKKTYTALLLLVATATQIRAQTTGPIGSVICPPNDLCASEPPPCPTGQAAFDLDGCWKCCTITIPKCASQVCLSSPPACPAGGSPTGKGGCWGPCCFVN
ncbi:hypothetical protein BDN70DRAFT_66147 [Pholiota conissans]|uniref:Uncharacterized protein n=1 Tax=Pholiota conissans TaxID=109636 RepID=A0A9P5Z1L6_9AGAR|nr:hypothetical protein BDN70DRAFT_66147 [Pholiota conissans]